MIKQLTKLANHLDSVGLRKEADYLDFIIRKESSLLLGLALCFGVGCKQVTKEELKRVGIDYDFDYEVPGDENTITNVYAVPEGSAVRTDGDDQITLTWPCGNYEVLREILHLEPTQKLDNSFVEATWDFDSEGYLVSEVLFSGEVSTC